MLNLTARTLENDIIIRRDKENDLWYVGGICPVWCDEIGGDSTETFEPVFHFFTVNDKYFLEMLESVINSFQKVEDNAK